MGEIYDFQKKLEEIKQEMTSDQEPTLTVVEPEVTVSENYLDLKKQVKLLDEEMAKARAMLEKELSVAAMNGMTPETGDRIVDLQRSIEASMQKQQKALSNISEREAEIKSNMTKGFDQLKQGFNQVKSAISDKIVSGVATVGAFGEKVRDANQRAAKVATVSADTFNTQINENVEKVYRNYLSFNYSRDNVIANTLEKVAQKIEKAAERVGNIKEAFKDLGRAFTGKERQNAAPQLTPIQQKAVDQLRGMAENARQNMRDTEREFKLSQELSKVNIKDAMEYRQGESLKDSKGLNKLFEEVKRESLDLKEKQADAPAKEAVKDHGDRTV